MSGPTIRRRATSDAEAAVLELARAPLPALTPDEERAIDTLTGTRAE